MASLGFPLGLLAISYVSFMLLGLNPGFETLANTAPVLGSKATTAPLLAPKAA